MSSAKRNHLVRLVESSKPKNKKGKLSKAHDDVVHNITNCANELSSTETSLRTKKNKKRNAKRGKQRHSREILKKPRSGKAHTGKYVFFDWGVYPKETVLSYFNVESSNIVNMNSFTILDNYEQDRHNSTKHLIVLDRDNDDFVVAKVAPRQALDCTGNVDKWDEVRALLKEVKKQKPNVGRGGSRSGSNRAYKIFGYRKEPKGTTIGTYTFKSTASTKSKSYITKGVKKLCESIEIASKRVLRLLQESKMYEHLQDFFKIPHLSEGGYSTAFSIGYEYWSQVHKDLDYFPTSLSALAEESEDHDEILYYFVFPEYELSIPIRSGEILIFNPVLSHACTNPKYCGAIIFSAYVSKKTILTHLSTGDEDENDKEDGDE